MRKPQVSMRTLLIVMALLAVAIGWLADRQRLRNQLRQAADLDLQQRQKIFAMEREIEQLEANATALTFHAWKFLLNQQPPTR